MSGDRAIDLYEILQVSASAEPETVHRVYRLLAQRYHPDNASTGNENRFREITEAYQILSDPVRRAQYDVAHEQLRRDRWRMAEELRTENNFEAEQSTRLAVLEILYTRRRLEPDQKGLTPLDLEDLLGRAREHLDFTIWFLTQKKYVARSDSSVLVITVEGVEYLESHLAGMTHRRLSAGSPHADREVA